MYCRGLGLRVIGRFEDHEGFDGVMLGVAGAGYHFEFTHCRTHPVLPTPTVEDLAVFYVPFVSEWQAMCDSMLAAGFKKSRRSIHTGTQEAIPMRIAMAIASSCNKRSGAMSRRLD